MESSTDECKIQRLSSENYHTWSIRARAALVQKGCWEAIDPGYGAEMTAVEKKANDKALTFLFLVVEDTFLDDIGTMNIAKEAWKTLKELHSKHGLLHTLQLMRDFFNVRMKKDESMRAYLGRLMDLHRKLTDLKYNLEDREVALVMLMGLPETYETLIFSLEQEEESIITAKVKARLLVEEKRQARHIADRVTDKEEEEAKELLTSSRGVSRDKHYKKGKPTKRESQLKKQNDNERRRVRCYSCGKFGHIAKECPLPDEEKSTAGTTCSDNKHHAKMTTHRAMAATHVTRSGPTTWYLDSGATDHMTSHQEKLSDYATYSSYVETADRNSVEVKGKETAAFEQEDANRVMAIILKEVLYVPALDSNLLSVGRMEEMGLKVIFGNGKAEIMEQNGDVIMTARKKGRLYEVIERNTAVMMAKNIGLLHKRLGHLNMDAVKRVNKESNTEDEALEGTERCEICIRGKMSRRPFPAGATRAVELLELIHSDVVGPIEPTTKSGTRYLISFVDDFSRYAVVLPMKMKNEALEKFQEYKSMAENLHSKKIKTLRSDNGREYRNEEFDTFLAKEGIVRQLTVPRTPQQNGVAERFNRTLLDMTRCLLLESGVTKTLWADAACTACYIRNRCPSNSIDKRTP